MEATKQAFDWQKALVKTYQDVAQQFIEHIPHIFGAILLLAAGWLTATLLRILTRKIMRALDLVFEKAAHKKGIYEPTQRSYANLAGDIVYWSVLIFFIAASGNMLELQIFSKLTSALLTYLPNVITGLMIILVGFALSGITRSSVASATMSAGIMHSDILARIAQVTVVLTAIVIGVEQLGINVAFISTTLVVAAGVLLSGAALAFGLGAKYFVANVISSQTTRKHYHIGQRIRFNDIEGFILDITSTMIIIDTPQGRATIPALLFQRTVCEVIDDPDSASRFDENELMNTGDEDDN
ncbi:MAG: hypothetical protein ACI84K_001764 [Pseudohongiellaceae bacterium]|jgi:hypothetical protein